MMFVGIVVVPFTLYLYAAHPAWMWMYLVDPDRVPGLALIPFLVLHGGMVVAGWYTGARLVRSNKTRAAIYSAGGGAALVLLMVIPLWGRLGLYGTYEAFIDQPTRALPIMEVKLGYVLVALILGAGAAALFVALELSRDSRRVRSR